MGIKKQTIIKITEYDTDVKEPIEIVVSSMANIQGFSCGGSENEFFKNRRKAYQWIIDWLSGLVEKELPELIDKTSSSPQKPQEETIK